MSLKLSLRVLSLLVLLATATGCTIKLAYNNLDRMIRWQVSDYVDFDDAQSEYFAGELDELLYWHRTTQLPLYAARAERMAMDLSEEVTAADLDALFAQAVGWADVVEQRAVPLMVELMLSLSDEQVAELPEKFAESNAEFMEDEIELTLPEAQELWRERVTDGMKYFAGRLNRSQRDYVAAQSVRYQPEFVLWVEFRKRWQAELLGALEERQDHEKFETRFRALIDDRESLWGEEFTTATRANEKLSRDVLVGLLARLDDEQSKRFAQRLNSLAEDFRDLSARGKAPESVERCLARCG